MEPSPRVHRRRISVADYRNSLLDVRQPEELVVEQVSDSVNIPLGEPRARISDLSRDREIRVICGSGQRACFATRVLLQNGFDARTVSGGLLSRRILSSAVGPRPGGGGSGRPEGLQGAAAAHDDPFAWYAVG